MPIRGCRAPWEASRENRDASKPAHVAAERLPWVWLLGSCAPGMAPLGPGGIGDRSWIEEGGLMHRKRFSITLATGLALLFGGAWIAAAVTHPPDINPANFARYVTNPFFPLPPGTKFFYEGEKDGVPTSNVTEVTCDTKLILGVKTTVVHDQAFDEHGELAEGRRPVPP